uniref:Structural maintenance of chromosomes protein n=1 Tax=Photinus pyralis TaxID=7054 RepID=A0A1Y1M3E5_PHOPY
MYIKSIVLDGFKSYGQRTEIHGFDREFNAITGLNGTGKSNILDSICFVLGISNLSQVRAGNLQDLIYRSGQAGVTKATVSITFDNRNSQQSPPGFEDYEEITISRQVAMGGKNKYLLNGSVVQNKRIQDLFCSVQLNVNNPHFLIMQGRITKVLNMKPPEILAMIEEAAGTRMYETKRQQAQKTIEKKDAKLEELNKIMQEEIGPKLDKLREERAAYLEFQRVERELEHMLGLYQAWQYIASKRNCARAEEALKAGQAHVQQIHDNITDNNQKIKNIESKVEEMTAAIQSSGSENLKRVEAELKENEKADAKVRAAEKSAKESIAAEAKKKKQLEKNLKEDEAVLKSKEQDLQKVQGLFEQLKNAELADNEALATAQRKYEAISVGMEVNDAGETETLQDQLMGTKQKLAEASTEIKQATMQLSHQQSQLKEKQKDLNSNTSDYERDKKNMQKMEQEVRQLERNLGNLHYSEEEMTTLQNQRQALRMEIRALREKIDNFDAHNRHTNFQYRDPETNFNRGRVNGQVCRLIQLRDRETGVALETAAGGKLFNVVVDTDVTSKKLLERGNLQSRTTFIPLNKIQGGKIDQRTIKFAQDLVGIENVQPALSLISYDRQLQAAMEFVFGYAFIGKDLNIARQVTFHDQIRRKCVTLEGDVTDPSGILSGGARHKGPSILLLLEDVQKEEAKLKAKEMELYQIENRIREMSGTQEQYLTLKRQLEIKQHELQVLQQCLQQTTHHQRQEEVNEIKRNIEELKNKIETCKETEKTCASKIKELGVKMKDSKGHRERLLKEAENEMERLRKEAEASSKNWKQHEQEYESLNLEISELKTGLASYGEQISKCDEQLVSLNEKYVELQRDAEEKKETVARLQQQVKAEKGAISEQNRDIAKQVKMIEELRTQIGEFELQIKEQAHEIKKLEENFKNSKNREAEYKKKTKKDDKNQKDAEELTDKNAGDLEKRIRAAQDKRVKLSRTVNAKAQSLFEHEEKQYAQLLKKKGIVESDKNKLIAVMADLDKKKQETLLLAWEQVSKDFGSIFGTLLPNSNAKLIPPHGQNVLQGLEVKIFLGGVWKESLSELSGGQRSLVALSLILAMLLFKPAPLYILDEVDAALDLSHTQNIGNMLKSHFKQSQFIIVSLKDGMFNNANVLFRTKFVDGVSAVSRTVNKAH